MATDQPVSEGYEEISSRGKCHLHLEPIIFPIWRTSETHVGLLLKSLQRRQGAHSCRRLFSSPTRGGARTSLMAYSLCPLQQRSQPSRSAVPLSSRARSLTAWKMVLESAPKASCSGYVLATICNGKETKLRYFKKGTRTLLPAGAFVIRNSLQSQRCASFGSKSASITLHLPMVCAAL